MHRVITTAIALVFCTGVHSLTLGQRAPKGGRPVTPSARQPSPSDQESLSSIGIEYCDGPADCKTISVYGKPKTCVHCRNRDGPKQGYCSEMLDSTLINIDWSRKTHDDLCRSQTYALHCGRCPSVETASGGSPVAPSPNSPSPEAPSPNSPSPGVQLSIPQPENPENYFLNPTPDDSFKILSFPETNNPVVPEQRLKTDQKPKIEQQPASNSPSPGVQWSIPQPENPENYFLNPTPDDSFKIPTGVPETSTPAVPEQRLKTDQKPKVEQQPKIEQAPINDPRPKEGPVLSFLPDSPLPMSHIPQGFSFDPGYPSEDPLTGPVFS